MPQIPKQQDEPAITDDEIWQECSERLQLAIEAEGNNRTKALEALEFLDGKQWPDDLYNQRKINKRPSLTINHTRTFRNRVVNNMKQQRPRIKVHPVGDGADVDKAQKIGGLLRHIEVMSKADVSYDTAGSSAVDIGWGYARVDTEYVNNKSMDQEIVILPIRNTFTVYMDPSSIMPAGEDAEWCIITEKLKRKEFKRLYPKEELDEFTRSGVGDYQSMWETKTEIRLAEYYRINKVTDELLEFNTGESILKSDYKKNKAAIDAAGLTIVSSRPSYRKAIEWYRITGTKIVARRAEGEKAPNGPLPGEYIPIVRCEGNVLYLNGETRRKGMIEDLMDPARMFNYWRTAETEQLALASKAPWIGPEGFRDGHPEWNNANQTPYSALEYKPVLFDNGQGVMAPLPPPQRNPAIEVPAGFVQAAQSAEHDLMAVAGMPHEPGQDTPGAIVSGVALRRREALSDIGHFQYYDNQTRFICHIGRICLSWIPTYYSQATQQRIIGEDGVPEVVDISDAAAIGRYDVVMDTGPGYDTKRLEGAETMIDLLKTPLAEPIAKVGADLVIRNMDFAGASDLADRLMPMTPDGLKKATEGLPKQAQSIVNAMNAHMQQLQQKIQEQAMEIKYKTTIEQGWMQVEREKTKEKLTADANNNATKQFDTHVKSVTARDVAEIKAGAEIMGKHQDAGYEAIARKETLEAATKAEKLNG
jgi:Phage P22-like portal protein